MGYGSVEGCQRALERAKTALLEYGGLPKEFSVDELCALVSDRIEQVMTGQTLPRAREEGLVGDEANYMALSAVGLSVGETAAADYARRFGITDGSVLGRIKDVGSMFVALETTAKLIVLKARIAAKINAEGKFRV